MLNFRHVCVLQTLDTVRTVIKTGFEHVKICYSIGQYLKDLRSTVNKLLNLVSLSGRLDKIVYMYLGTRVILLWCCNCNYIMGIDYCEF